MNRLMTLAVAGAFSGLMAEAGTADTSGNKTPKFAEKDYDIETGLAEFSFGNGKSLSVDVAQLNEEMRTRLMFHGLLQKVGDSYAGAKGDYSKAIESAQGVIEQLLGGEWRAARGEGGTGPRLGELAEAISEIKGIPLEEARAAVDTAAALQGTDDEKKAGAEKLKAWRAHPKIKAVIASQKARKAQAELEAAGDAAGEISLG